MPACERYAILSDIHGNLRALQAALAMAQEYGAEKICCLGDIIGYGANSAACLQLVREKCAFIVQGNHDAQIQPPRDPSMRPEAVEALDYALGTVGLPEIAWLKKLPHPLLIDNDFAIAHGALTGRDRYILKQDDARENMSILARDFQPAALLFFGHTHLPMALTASGAKTDFTQGGTVSLAPGRQYLFNPGSVGQSRDGNPAACFCLYDRGDRQVIYLRAEYDVAAEQEDMRKAGLPQKSIQRLALGR